MKVKTKKVGCGERKNAFDGLISRPDMADKRISGLEDISIETFKIEKQREQRLKKPEYSRTVGQLQKV